VLEVWSRTIKLEAPPKLDVEIMGWVLEASLIPEELAAAEFVEEINSLGWLLEAEYMMSELETDGLCTLLEGW